MKWNKLKLGDLFQVKHGWAFKGEYFSNEGELIIVTPGNFFEKGGFRQIIGKEKYYLGEFSEEFLLKRDDVVIAMTEQGPGLLGSPALIPNDEKYLHNQRIGLITKVDFTRIDPMFIYRLFFTSTVRNEIFASATGTKVKHTAPKRIYDIEVEIPPLLVQLRIASILSAYDDLIGNNLKRIKLLEEKAFLSYKTIVNNEKMEELTIEKLANVVMGQSPTSDTYNEENDGLPFHQGVTNFSNYFVEHKIYCKTPIKIADEGDILFSVRAPVGRINFTNDKICIGRGLCAFRSKKGFQNYFYHQLKEFFFAEDVIGNGAIFNAVTKVELMNVKLKTPSFKIQKEFEKEAQGIYNLILNLTKQNAKLREARDILLPRLMSGEIKV
jgi:type I restriction enzyme, S subunit